MKTALTQAQAEPPEAFYLASQKIYPREIDGRFARLRKRAAVVLLGLFYAVAWLEWDGHQALLFDLPARKFHIFALTLWPQDFLYLALLLIIAALSLFFVTALAGRLWCGYACPQTAWTELFIWIEQWTEGGRSQRMKLDRSPWTAGKLARKTLKQVLWVGLALYTGFTFVGYFTPIHSLGTRLLTGQAGSWAVLWILLYSLATYGNAGFLREQVCKYMCPYARFQSAMFDRDTLVISYDPRRGEPRGARRRGSDARAQGRGDCIDCTLCVQVCPTGIDIREGLQNECIACGACIDACDGVMDKMGSARGLIRYTTEQALQGQRTELLRPRIAVYAGLLAGVTGFLVYSLLTRVPLIVDVIRDRNALYREVHGDRIENTYSLKVINLDDAAHSYRLAVSGVEALQIAAPAAPIALAPGSVSTVITRLEAPGIQAQGVRPITFTLTAIDKPAITVSEKARFIGPKP
jgi:cytochrome c oxidase accessory protein FixG